MIRWLPFVLVGCSGSPEAAVPESLPGAPLHGVAPHDGGVARGTLLLLGDSITFGVGDPEHNGFHGKIGNDLGPEVTLVGSVVAGTPPTRMSGYPGFRTVDVLSRVIDPHFLIFGTSVAVCPDVIQLLIGTNDAATDADAQSFPDHYVALVRQLHVRCEAAHFVLSTIPQSGQTVRARNIPTINASLPGLWRQLAREGLRIETADADVLVGPEDYDPVERAAWVHPNPTGYTKLVRVFEPAIVSSF